MSTGQNDFQQKLNKYDEKKVKCLQVIRDSQKLAEEYIASFPPPDKANTDNLPKQFAELANKMENAKLKILVAGQFKMGKSTIINALLGEEVLPAYSTPCTAVITEIGYGEEKKAILSFKPKINQLPDGLAEKVKAHIGDKKENIPDLVVKSEALGDELEEYLVIPMEEMDKKQEQSVAESPYALCRLSWPIELCKKNVEIIDSPGLNEANARDETTYKYVPQADMIVHALTALQLYGKYDKTFVEALERNSNPPLVFLVNRFDQLNSDAERERIRKYAHQILTPHTPYGKEGIFFISAFHALKGKITDNHQLYAESGFDQFDKMLAKIVESDSVRMKLASNLQGTINILNSLANNTIPEVRKKMDGDLADLQRKYQARQDEFAKLDQKKERIKHTIESTLSNIQRLMESEIKHFFTHFAAESLEEYVNQAEFEISIFNKEKSHKEAAEAMSEEMLNGLRREFDEFNAEKTKEIAESMRDLKEELKYQIEEFNEQLNAIRVDLDMKVDDSKMSISHGDLGSIDFSDMIAEGTAGAFVGATAGVGAVFLASRLFAIFGGPIGWGITILSTLGAALFALLNSSAAADKMKQEYIKTAKKKMREESGNWAKTLSDDLGKTLNEQKNIFMGLLESRIENTKNPILEAIELMKNSKSDLDQKKIELDKFRERFSALAAAGTKLEASL